MLVMNVSDQCMLLASNGHQIRGLVRRNITYKERELCKTMVGLI